MFGYKILPDDLARNLPQDLSEDRACVLDQKLLKAQAFARDFEDGILARESCTSCSNELLLSAVPARNFGFL